MKVTVLQFPYSTFWTSRSPCGARPYRRVIVVDTLISSMNTSLLGSSFPCRRCNALRAAATSGRSCSAARENFRSSSQKDFCNNIRQRRSFSNVGPACFCSSRQAFFLSAVPTRPRCERAVVMAVGASFVRQSRSTALWGSGISVRGTNFRSSHRTAEQICNKSTARVVAAKCQDCDDDRNPDEGAEQSPHEGPEEDGKQHDER
jgi:hypothetical protein